MINTTDENSLVLDYSQELGYSCLVLVSPWEKGISWTSLIDGEKVISSDFLDDPWLPFSTIYKTESAYPWINSIPKDLIADLLEYEKIYHRTSMYALLWLLSRYQSAIDLFTSNPFKPNNLFDTPKIYAILIGEHEAYYAAFLC